MTSPRWENNTGYCAEVMVNKTTELVLNYVDGAVFDYVISNLDRHHAESLREHKQSFLLLDNGKRLANELISIETYI